MGVRVRVPPPPTPPDPEGDTGDQTLSASRRDYRIATNGAEFVIQCRFFLFFWNEVMRAPSQDWAERWVQEQMRRAKQRNGPWKVVA